MNIKIDYSEAIALLMNIVNNADILWVNCLSPQPNEALMD